MATYIKTVRMNGKDFFYKLGSKSLPCGAKTDAFIRITKSEAEFYQRIVGKITDQYMDGVRSVVVHKYDI